MPDTPPPMFITYDHVDLPWLEKLQLHLEPALKRRGTFAWDDRRIKPGEKWYDAIHNALHSARLGVVLVSPDWLESEFVNKEEWPVLEAASQRGRVNILWVVVRSCLYDTHPIAQYQSVGNPGEPLDALSPAAQDAALVRICRKILDELPAPLPPQPLLPPENVRRRASPPAA